MMHMTAGEIGAAGVSVSALADALSRQRELGGREILDHTGLTGTYDVTLKWTPETPEQVQFSGGEGADDAPATDATGTSIFTALQEQLGLRLESQKASVETLVIEHIEEPSAN